MNIIPILAQIPIPTSLPDDIRQATEVATEASQQQGLEFGAAVLGLFLSIVGFFKIVMPALGKRYQRNLETSAEKEAYEFQKDQQEDSLALSARSFLDEQARDSIASVRTIAEDCQDKLEKIQEDKMATAIQLARLEERDKLRQESFDEMKSKQEDTDALLGTYQSDMATMQAKVKNLTSELTITKRKVSELETKLATSEENRIALALELEEEKTRVAGMEEELGEKNNIINQLRTKIIEYRAKDGKGAFTDTDELLGLTGEE